MTMRNESDTRADLIDPKLFDAGWNRQEQARIRREEICPGRIMVGGRRGKPVISDYVLIYRGRKLAVIEAKKESLSYTEGVRQAKDYADLLQCRFAYASNGHEIYQIDMHTGEESLVDEFLSPDELWSLSFDVANQQPAYTLEWRRRFSETPLSTKGNWQPRYYQENAINNVLEAIAAGDDRVLLTLATGTGKTSIAFQIAWKLFNSRWSLTSRLNSELAKRRPRILFLADRNVLANQAFNDFDAFGEDALARIEPDEIRKHGAVPKNSSVFFTIFQTFMSGGVDENGESKAYYGDYSPDFFDFIIIDECHRGGANDESSWRCILEHFAPAVQLGLTATPKRTDNVDTYNYFGEPVYTYTLKEGVNDGFLTPFKVVPIVGTMDEYIYTPHDGLIVKGEPEAGRLYKEGDFNRLITIPERERKRVEYWMDMFHPNEKTIVFCATQEHAGLVRDMVNQYAVKQGWTTNPNYCVRVTAEDGQAGEADLKTFRDNENTIPTVLTTSRKLSTGVDARNIRNIVLMRPCNNMIEFKQIIGRGTRLYEGKEFFTIYDFVKAHYNFADPEWDGDPAEVVIPEKRDKPDEINDRDDNESSIELTPPDLPPEDLPETFRPEKIEIALSDGKIRQIRHISSVMYWNPEGKPITAREFVMRMFDDLPQFFGDEDELRSIWSNPETRDKLLVDLAEAGYDKQQLDAMKELIEARDSDVYDVLAYVAYAAETQTRQERVEHASPQIQRAFTDPKQQEFIDFILSHYVGHGVEELSLSKMRDLLELKYHSIHDARNQIGSTGAIRDAFVGCQQYLYQASV